MATSDENEVRIYNCLMREILVFDRTTDDLVSRIMPQEGPPPTLVHMAGAPNVIGSLFHDRIPVLDARFDMVMHLPNVEDDIQNGHKVCLIVNQLVAQFLSQHPHMYDAQKVVILSPNMADAKRSADGTRVEGIYSFLAFPAIQITRPLIQHAVTLSTPAHPPAPQSPRIKLKKDGYPPLLLHHAPPAA